MCTNNILSLSLQDIILEQRKDPFYLKLKDYLNNKDVLPNFTSHVDSAFFNKFILDWILDEQILKVVLTNRNGCTRILTYLPPILAPQVIKYIHSSMFGAHFSVDRTLSTFRDVFITMNDYSICKNIIDSCSLCIVHKRKKTFKPQLNPFQIETTPFHTVGMDFLGPFQETKNGKRYLLVLIDYFSKYPFVIPTKNRTAETVARAILFNIIPSFGCMKNIIMDNAPEFAGNVMSILLQKLGVTKKSIPSYSPQCNGQCERLMKDITNVLRVFCNDHTNDWDEYVPIFLTAYRNTPHASTQMSPFYILFGYDMPVPYRMLFDKSEITQNVGMSGPPYVQYMINKFQYVYKYIKENIQGRKQYQKSYVDASASKVNVTVGMYCFVRKNKVLGLNLSNAQ